MRSRILSGHVFCLGSWDRFSRPLFSVFAVCSISCCSVGLGHPPSSHWALAGLFLRLTGSIDCTLWLCSSVPASPPIPAHALLSCRFKLLPEKHPRILCG